MERKVHFVILIILLFVVCFSVSASYEPIVPSNRSFWLIHIIGKDSRFSAYFKGTDAMHDGIISSYEFQQAGTYRFARFCIKINQDIGFTSIELLFSPMVHTTENQVYYEYTMRILKPYTNTVIAPVTDSQDVNYKYTAQLVDEEMDLEISDDMDWEEKEIADLEITLDDEDSISGQYEGTITCIITAKDTI